MKGFCFIGSGSAFIDNRKLRALQVALAAYESAAQGQPVSITTD